MSSNQTTIFTNPTKFSILSPDSIITEKHPEDHSSILHRLVSQFIACLVEIKNNTKRLLRKNAKKKKKNLLYIYTHSSVY